MIPHRQFRGLIKCLLREIVESKIPYVKIVAAPEFLPHVIFSVLKPFAQLRKPFGRCGGALISDRILGPAYVVKELDLLIGKLLVYDLNDVRPFV